MWRMQRVVLLIWTPLAIAGESLPDGRFVEITADIRRAGPVEVGDSIGTLVLRSEDGQLKITGKLSGLTPGLHGFHIHEKSDLSNNCMATGGHFNPLNKKHGAPEDEERHVGDLGNILVKSDGSVDIDITDKLATLDGPLGVLGRAFVVHEKADDLGKGGDEGSLKTGNAGSRIACGVIGKTESSHGNQVWPAVFTMALLLPVIILHNH